MNEVKELGSAIDRASKYAVRALKRNDDIAAYNTLKALVHMHIRNNNLSKALLIIRIAKKIFEDF